MNDNDIFESVIKKHFGNDFQLSIDEENNKYNACLAKLNNISGNTYELYFVKAYCLHKLESNTEALRNIKEAIKKLGPNNEEYNIFNWHKEMANFPFYKNKDEARDHFMQTFYKKAYYTYELAGEIYAKNKKQVEALGLYKKAMYYYSFLYPEFKSNKTIRVFSFRKYNQFTLADLINNEITVSSSTCMNDPFDSLINLWGEEGNLSKTCKEQLHIKPLHEALEFYRIRSFCMGRGNESVKNILMWSHYADEHKGFCIKYKLSQHFIKQDENENGQHMFMKKVKYRNIKFDLDIKSIDTDLAFTTKKKDWVYEKEVRLIVYDMKDKGLHYGIPLDNDSRIEAIYFGYLCPRSTIKTIQNIFLERGVKLPKFYKMKLNPHDVYNLQIEKCTISL